MFTLVRFVLDNVYYVCKSENVKERSKNKYQARWIDGYYYSAVVIYKHSSEETLQHLKSKLEKHPVVALYKSVDKKNDPKQAISPLLKKGICNKITENLTEPNLQLLQCSNIKVDHRTDEINVQIHDSVACNESNATSIRIEDIPLESLDCEELCSLPTQLCDFANKYHGSVNSGESTDVKILDCNELEIGLLQLNKAENDHISATTIVPDELEETNDTRILDCGQSEAGLSQLNGAENDHVSATTILPDKLDCLEGVVNFGETIDIEMLDCDQSEADLSQLNMAQNNNASVTNAVLHELDSLEFSTQENLIQPDLPFSEEVPEKLNRKKYVPFLYNRSAVITPSYKDHERANVNELTVSSSEVKGRRKHFCIYCKKLYAKFSQHLEVSHRNEAAVKMFLVLPTKNIERRKIIETIRRRGDFEYSTSQNFKSQELLVARRSHTNFLRESKDYLPCPHCAAFFYNRTLRNHIKHCLLSTQRGKTSVKNQSRSFLCNLHPIANEVLKTKIFPIFRDDDCVNIIRYDTLAIVLGNFMCSKYVSQHHHDMIRSRLRSIGRLLITAKSLDNTVKDFADLLTPSKFDLTVAAIKQVGGINQNSTVYRAPTTVLNLSTLCKQACGIWKSECIKMSDFEGQRKVDDFLNLFNVTFPAELGTTAVENRLEHQRQKHVDLPSVEDIKKLVSYLREQRRNWFSRVKREVNNLKYAVKQLASFTLVSLMVFNRRRPGELERITLNDFSNLRSAQSLSTSTGHTIHQEEDDLTKRYKRFEIRGKLNRTVPVLVDFEMEECINLIIAKRKDAGLGLENQYVFGYPSGDDRPKYLRAYILLRDYANRCGAAKPHLLRATHLRKQIATECALDDMAENVIHDVANFMGHSIDIHNNIYRMPVEKRDIFRISKILERMQGDTEDVDDSLSENEQDVASTGPSTSSELTDRGSALISNDEPMSGEPYQDSFTSRSESEELPSNVKPKKARGKGFTRVCSSKKPWSSVEKQAALQHFNKYLVKQKLPSIAFLCEQIPLIPDLQKRSPTSVKTWLQNHLLKKKQLPETDSCKIRRTRWSSPMKRRLNSIFVEHFDAGTLPSLAECSAAINNHTEFQDLNPAALKTAVANEQQRRSKQLKDPPLNRTLFVK